jgi:outer membrane protein assembly factor BamB
MTRLALALLVAAAAAQTRPAASNWYQWRGPSNNGVATGDAPATWSDSSNVAWKVAIPGRGHSSPVVWEDRIFLTTAIPTAAPPATPSEAAGSDRRGRDAAPLVEHRFVVMALDRATGKVVWERTATVATPHEPHHFQYGSFASNSPVTDGRRVYASFGSRGLYAYDMNGKELWNTDFGLKLQMFRQFGEGTAPVLDGDRLIVLMDHQGDSFIAMLDAATGKQLWRTPRTGDSVTNWSTPYVARHRGTKQIIVSASQRVLSYDYETGKPIWSATGLGQNTIPQPVQHGDLVWVMSGYRNPKGMAIRLGREGDLTGTDAIVWTQDRGLSYTASPALHEGILYMITDTAMVSAFDLTAGQPHYHQVRLPKPYNIKASPVVANGKIYYATEEGDVIVARTGPSWEIVATNTLADQSFIATPAVSGGDIYLRSRTHLFRIAD